MKKTNKFLAIILAILMIISIVPITSSAATYSDTCGYNVIWSFDESTGTLTISGTGDMYDGEFSYPSWDTHIIESVIISEGVTSIGEEAFCYDTTIKNVSIADSVTDIGDYAFYNCTGLSNVIIGKGVTNIGDEAFYNCTGLTEVVIGKGVTTIGIRAFKDCSNLESVTIYNAVEEIVRDSFTGCSELTDVYYFGTEAEWNAISKGSFFSKTGLEKATIHFLGEETHECSYNAVVTAPTCTEQGYTTYTCVCGDTYVDDYVNATGHNYEKSVTAPTCTEQGYTTYTCDCGDKFKSDYTPKNGHEYKMAESELKEATCTEGGYRYVQCLNCDHIWYFNFVDAKGHWYEETITMPTCTEPGYIYFVCKCGDAFGESLDAFGHTEETVPAVAPTCTEIGLTAGTKCSECGEIVKEQEVVPAKGHKYTSKITTPATDTTTGIMTYTCTCGDSYTEVIEKNGEHNYVAVVTAPTCTARGYTTYTCECGDSYVADYVNATGHTEEIITAVAPTCTETGLTEGEKCSVCGDTLTEQKELPANGHTPANAVEENYVAPTCTENGSKDVVIYCSVCDEEISRETETIEATGHADNDGDGYCDADNELLDPSVECDHSCHSDSFFRALFWKIINFFNKLFGLSKTCECGVAHY